MSELACKECGDTAGPFYKGRCEDCLEKSGE